MKCSQTGCPHDGIARYTWPGRNEAVICAEHRPKLLAVAEACDLKLEVIDLPRLVVLSLPKVP
jgi:hypothetical protein